MNSPMRHFPVIQSKAIASNQCASWPAVSIVILMVLAVLFPPGMLSGMNLYLLLLAGIVWLFSGERLEKNLLRVIVPFGFIIILGLMFGAGAERYIYLKDAWYVSNPAVVMTVGYVLYRCMPDLAKGYRAFVIAGTLVSILHLVKFALHPDLLSLDADKLRETIGTGYYAPVPALIIIFACRRQWPVALKLPRWLAIGCMVICITAIGSSFSRTMLIVTLLGVLALWGVFAPGKWLRIVVVFLLCVLTIVALRSTIDVNSRDASTSVMGKFARATDELTIEEYSDLRSINLNWRGYETARAIKYYAAGSPVNWLFGYGFGAELDIGLFMPLGTGPRGERIPVKFVPVLHNGYAFLLVKGGGVAVVLFVFSLLSLYRVGHRLAGGAVADDQRVSAARILQASVISLAFTTWVIAGVFNKLDMFSFLLLAGFLLAVLSQKGQA